MHTSVLKFTLQGASYSLSTEKERIACLTSCLSKFKYHSLVERDALIAGLLGKIGSLPIKGRFLNEEQILALQQAGMEIGAHTHNHPILLKESDDTALYEIKDSKHILEKIINEPVKYFAYPNGKYQLDFNFKHIEIVKEMGFQAAFSTDLGNFSNAEKELFNIKRFNPWEKNELSFTLRLALNFWK